LKKPAILALVLAGGAGGRLEQLTDTRAKPVVPYAGVYRLIDFPLSNCLHSGISDVWIIEQFHPQSLNDHVSNGRPWDLDRTHGGMKVLHPHLGGSGSGWHQGNADAIYRNRAVISEFAPDVLLVLSADHVYELDYSKVIDYHAEQRADVTMVTTKVVGDDPGRFGIVQTDDDGHITDYQYKPESPSGDIATTEIFVFDAAKLMDELDRIAGEKESGDDDEEPALDDLGEELLPALVKEGNAFDYRLEGYWRDVGTIDSYWRSHMDLVAPDRGLNMDNQAWPILTLAPQRPPAHIYPSSRNENSLVSPGCTVRGRVIRSVLGPGVLVDEGATVRNSILLHDSVVESGATVETAIIDMGARIGKEARVGGSTEGSDAADVSAESIAVVGAGAIVGRGATVPPGGRIDPAD